MISLIQLFAIVGVMSAWAMGGWIAYTISKSIFGDADANDSFTFMLFAWPIVASFLLTFYLCELLRSLVCLPWTLNRIEKTLKSLKKRKKK